MQMLGVPLEVMLENMLIDDYPRLHIYGVSVEHGCLHTDSISSFTIVYVLE